MEENESATTTTRQDDAPRAGEQLVTVETQREFDLLSGDWQERTFVKLYVEARRSGLLAAISDRDWKTLCTLATYMDGDGYCYPSQSELARALGCSRQMANERVKSLAAFRFGNKAVLLVVKGERGGDGRWARNGYRILPLSSLRMFDQERSPSESQHSIEELPEDSVSRKVDTVTDDSMSSPTVTVPVDTNKNQGSKQDFSLRNSKEDSDQKDTDDTTSQRGDARPHQSDRQSVTRYRTASPREARPSHFVPVAETLGRLHMTLQPVIAAVPEQSQPLTPASAQLVACVAEIAQELGDRRHLRSNTTQAQRLLERSGIHEGVFISRLYEAHAITKDRRRSVISSQGRTVAKPMAYFWIVVRDLLGLRTADSEAVTASDAQGGALGQGGGEEWTNDQRDA